MKQLLIQLDDVTAAQLEKVAPGRSHTRSAFVRQALARALQEEMERRTREAYEKWPDEPAVFDPSEWAPASEAIHPAESSASAGKVRRPTSRKGARR